MLGDLFAAPPAGYARVALPLGVDRLFDYAVPAGLAASAEPGRRVRVQVDARRLTGVIVERTTIAAVPAGSRVREIEAVLDAAPVLPAPLLEMLREEAGRLLCPIGIALQTALPPDAPRARPEKAALTSRGRAALSSGAVRGEAQALLSALEAGPRPVRALCGATRWRDLLAGLEGDGLVVRRRMGEAARAAPPSERVARLAGGVEAGALLPELARAPKQAAVVRTLTASGALPVAELARRVTGAARALRELAARGVVEIETRSRAARVETGLEEPGTLPPLTADQGRALSAVEAAVREGRSERFLLHGVTGSGKTEVYLRATAAALGKGRQALLLVPEITLTHQILARLRGRFGDRVAVLHSGLARGERLGQWERLRTGATPIAVGARSALFAPLARLGVVVLDEEHDPAYKNEEGFRYHARDLARRRAADAGCPLVLGSATPALETRLAAERGELQRLVLPHRIGGRPLPAVEIVDLARERALSPRGRKLLLSPPLRRALRQVLGEGGQSILFLNRRGFSTQILCFDCGHVERCKHCDIALVYHASEQRLRCHYCDYRVPPPETCSGCGAPDTALLGVGTERLVEEVRSVFPGARVARLDRDAAAGAGAVARVLRELEGGRIDVLVGTQMVTKGHDFPGVRLVGIVNADLSLQFPDFRAAERTFQLLTQVSGRAGRGNAPGRVILQTYVPDHYAIQPVRTHDYERFYREEMRHREALGYPPCGHLAQAVVSGRDEEATRLAAHALAERARAASQEVEVLGPAPAPLARLRGRHRQQILLKAGEERVVHLAARALREGTAMLTRELRVALDLAPVNLL